jgi:hypothetical protein
VADSTADKGGIANDVAETFDDVEDDGYGVSAIAATRAVRGALRKARGTDGRKLVDVQTGQGLDAPITYVANGVFSPDTTLAVAGDDVRRPGAAALARRASVRTASSAWPEAPRRPATRHPCVLPLRSVVRHQLRVRTGRVDLALRHRRSRRSRALTQVIPQRRSVAAA